MNAEPSDNSLVRVGDAAHALGMDARDVYAAIERGDLPARRLTGHGIRVQRADLERFAAVHPSSS